MSSRAPPPSGLAQILTSMAPSILTWTSILVLVLAALPFLLEVATRQAYPVPPKGTAHSPMDETMSAVICTDESPIDLRLASVCLICQALRS
jgi:hypothetical protein